MNVNLLVQLLAALGGTSGLAAGVNSYLDHRRNRGKVSADAARELTDAALGLINPSREQVEYLAKQLVERDARLRKAEAEIRTLRRLMVEMEDKVQVMTNQLERAGLRPSP